MAAHTTADRDALKTAANYSLATNIILGVLILLVGGIFIWQNYLAAAELPIEQSKLVKEIRERLVANADTIIVEGTDLALEAVPPAAEDFVQQVKADLPVYLRITEREWEQLVADLKANLKEKAKKKFKFFLIKHRKVLKKQFPKLTEKQAIERLEQAVEKAYEKLLDRYYVERFVQQTATTRNLWQKVEPLPTPSEGDPKLQDQFVEYFADWAVLRLKDIAENQ